MNFWMRETYEPCSFLVCCRATIIAHPDVPRSRGVRESFFARGIPRRAWPERCPGKREPCRQTKQSLILLVQFVIPCPAILSKGDHHEKIGSSGSGCRMCIDHFHGYRRTGCS